MLSRAERRPGSLAASLLATCTWALERHNSARLGSGRTGLDRGGLTRWREREWKVVITEEWRFVGVGVEAAGCDGAWGM